MKISREIITGIITLAAIGLLVAGVNFLKGNSFFGGDQVYYAYFPSSGGVTPAASVYINGVDVGKVLSVENMHNSKDSLKMVKVTFNISDTDLKLTKGTEIEAGGIDLFSKGLTIHMGDFSEDGYHKTGSVLPGFVSVDVTSQIQAYVDPLSAKIQVALASIDKMVNGVSAFWDETATTEIEKSMKEIQIAIRKFGSAAEQIEGMLLEERIRLARIMTNVSEITDNLRASNDTVKAIVGDVKRITGDLVTADFTGTIASAKATLDNVNKILASAAAGEGTLGKLVKDDSLYYELIQSNESLQNLVNDLTAHPERYIHFSVFGTKSKGVPLTVDEEKKLREMLKP